MNKIARLKEILESSRRAVFFGGAGMSTESGIPDFRSAGGIYSETLHQEFSPEQMASHSYLMAHPAEFFDFYRRRFVYLDAAPNAGHYALAELERRGHLAAIVTQNIDGLHQAAGSRTVYELHGSIRRAHCMDCGTHYALDYIMEHTPIPYCSCGGIVRPTSCSMRKVSIPQRSRAPSQRSARRTRSSSAAHHSSSTLRRD